MIAAVLAAFAASAGPSPAPPWASEDLGRYITARDYPREALRRRQQGRVGFELDVTTDGRVNGCRILATSGSALLDQRTCAVLVERARIEPQLDVWGRPIASIVQSSIDWVIPRRPLVLINPRPPRSNRLAGRGYE